MWLRVAFMVERVGVGVGAREQWFPASSGAPVPCGEGDGVVLALHGGCGRFAQWRLLYILRPLRVTEYAVAGCYSSAVERGLDPLGRRIRRGIGHGEDV